MKKRYFVAATAALLAGGVLVEMQVGSKGLDRVTLVAPGGGGAATGVPLAGRGAAVVAARASIRPGVPGAAAPVAVEPREDLIMLPAATDDTQGLAANSSIWGEPAVLEAILVPRSFANLPPPPPGANAIAGFGRVSSGSYPLAGEINRASGADALTTALGQPLASSMVPEPATWLSMIVGLAMVGFNLRRRQGRRSVAS